jgi:hypothetical protein
MLDREGSARSSASILSPAGLRRAPGKQGEVLLKSEQVSDPMDVESLTCSAQTESVSAATGSICQKRGPHHAGLRCRLAFHPAKARCSSSRGEQEWLQALPFRRRSAQRRLTPRSAPSSFMLRMRLSQTFGGGSPRRTGPMANWCLTRRKACNSRPCGSWRATGRPRTTGGRLNRG